MQGVESPRLRVQQTAPQEVEVSWPQSAQGYQLESSVAPLPGGDWQQVPQAPDIRNGSFVLTLQPTDRERYFRLRAAGQAPLTVIDETSPANGANAVALTRPTIFQFTAPLAAGAVLDGTHLYAEFGGRKLLTRVELSSDRTRASLFYLENRAMHLTLVGFRADFRCGTLSEDDSRISRMVSDRTSMPRLRRQAAMAGRIRLPTMSKHQGLDDDAGEVLVRPVWLPGIGDSGHSVPRHTQAVAPLV